MAREKAALRACWCALVLWWACCAGGWLGGIGDYPRNPLAGPITDVSNLSRCLLPIRMGRPISSV